MTSNILRITTILFLFTAFPGQPAWAQGERGRREDPFDREEMIRRFDADGDGELSRKELEEALAWWGYAPPEIELLIDLADRFFMDPNLELIIIDELDLDDWERDFLLEVSGGDAVVTFMEVERALYDWFMPEEVKLLLGLLEELNQQNADAISMDELDLQEEDWEWEFLLEVSGGDAEMRLKDVEGALACWVLAEEH